MRDFIFQKTLFEKLQYLKQEMNNYVYIYMKQEMNNYVYIYMKQEMNNYVYIYMINLSLRFN